MMLSYLCFYIHTLILDYSILLELQINFWVEGSTSVVLESSISGCLLIAKEFLKYLLK